MNEWKLVSERYGVVASGMCLQSLTLLSDIDIDITPPGLFFNGRETSQTVGIEVIVPWLENRAAATNRVDLSWIMDTLEVTKYNPFLMSMIII